MPCYTVSYIVKIRGGEGQFTIFLVPYGVRDLFYGEETGPFPELDWSWCRWGKFFPPLKIEFQTKMSKSVLLQTELFTFTAHFVVLYIMPTAYLA